MKPAIEENESKEEKVANEKVWLQMPNKYYGRNHQ
jgi:hypothetical protein